jgi:CDGSH-type Zn-finger protein
MPTNNSLDSGNKKRIVVQKNGPYLVEGDVPLVRKEQVVTEYGEPIAWKKGDQFETDGSYELCRCGHSSNKPFCDKTHEKIGFDGTETAVTRPSIERRVNVGGNQHIVIRRDFAVCMDAGFCGTRFANIPKMVADIDDTRVRSQIIAMVERCPSGSYTYSIEQDEKDMEPDLPQEVAVVTEMTDEGPIMGPLWVTGNILIERSDGKPFETRNRVTLCRCGLSKTKPLCDGTHRELDIKE